MSKRNSSKSVKSNNVDVITSGYVNCGCRDCFNVTVTGDVRIPALCSACGESGCEVNNGECQSTFAYGCDE